MKMISNFTFPGDFLVFLWVKVIWSQFLMYQGKYSLLYLLYGVGLEGNIRKSSLTI